MILTIELCDFWINGNIVFFCPFHRPLWLCTTHRRKLYNCHLRCDQLSAIKLLASILLFIVKYVVKKSVWQPPCFLLFREVRMTLVCVLKTNRANRCVLIQVTLVSHKLKNCTIQTETLLSTKIFWNARKHISNLISKSNCMKSMVSYKKYMYIHFSFLDFPKYRVF